MPGIQKEQNASAKTQRTTPSEARCAREDSPDEPPTSGTVLVRRECSDEESRACQIASLPSVGTRSEATGRFEKTLSAPLCPHPEWAALDSESSVMGSLLALNAQLMWYERMSK